MFIQGGGGGGNLEAISHHHKVLSFVNSNKGCDGKGRVDIQRKFERIEVNQANILDVV